MAKRKKKQMSKANLFRLRLMVGIMFVCSIIFLPTTIILLIGMMPSLAAIAIDKSKTKSRAITVSAMNLAGCSPFLLELWTTTHDMDTALLIAMQARNMIIMYVTAASGYVIDFAVAGIVSSMLLQKAKMRIKRIEEKQKSLIERWGTKVTGKIPLDDYGFPIQND